jgi:hypothetical protein
MLAGMARLTAISAFLMTVATSSVFSLLNDGAGSDAASAP